MSAMRFKRLEHHSVTSEFTYDLPEQHIIEIFGSVKRFEEIISHKNDGSFGNEVTGEPITEEEDTQFWEFFDGYDYDREDDWWTDRKGGYEVTYEIPDKKNNE
tara:strand:- start:1007 stop:1315 length:309 start_codon:yes stop_codon:yes gene_type:complete